ncbi:MAG TPA: cbb3-type cytochrome c oxidase N-terminal domain-containing protein [Ignavibacteriaceae bacterium]|nr:cbb3-type cytochrome c oxidase N-terminal domain-containing protein [Ignavibacteriaceae bacterium]
MRKKFNHFVLIIILILISDSFAQNSNSTAAPAPDFPPSYYDVVALFLIAIIITGFIAIVYYEGRKEVVRVKKTVSAFARFRQYITRSAPIEKEADIMLDHDFDGIRELDNRVPPWFSWLFYVTIIFAVIYLLNYHVFQASPLQDEEYQMQVKEAEAQRTALVKSGAFLNEETVTLLTDPASLDAGKQIFTTNCIACHAADGGGLVGPNLTDDYWIHGGGIKNIFKTIKYGVTAKGMIAWQSQLNPKQMQEVASYVISLHGTKPANPKQPEGTIWKDSTVTTAAN